MPSSRPSRAAAATSADLERAFEGRFKDLRPEGIGGQARVFRARRVLTKEREVTDDVVALKIFLRPSEVQLIDREIATMMRVRHPTLANLLEYGTVTAAGGVLRYVASEWIEGMPLDRRLARGPLAPATVAAVGRDVATAVGEIWRERIVHRDVNPRNVVLDAGERKATLIDLGIAKPLDETSVTTRGFVRGTQGYMSPEQWDGDVELNCASDVFALGVVLTESLTGTHPTDRDQAELVTSRIVVADLAPVAPAGLVQLVQRMLASKPQYRPTPADVATRCAKLALTL